MARNKKNDARVEHTEERDNSSSPSAPSSSKAAAFPAPPDPLPTSKGSFTYRKKKKGNWTKTHEMGRVIFATVLTMGRGYTAILQLWIRDNLGIKKQCMLYFMGNDAEVSFCHHAVAVKGLPCRLHLP